MKKTLFLSFVAGLLLSSTTLAYDEQKDDGFRNATMRNGQLAAQSKLDSAILKRQQNYFNEKRRTTAVKNIKNQWLRHTLSRSVANTDGVSTYLNRSGSFIDYSGTRTFAGGGLTAPNNSKRNFRTRAYDYYINGGNAGTDALKRDVVRSSEHSPSRRSYRAYNSSAADIIASIRRIQKSRNTSEKVATGEQKMTHRIGDSQRNYLHPYMFGTK